MDFHYIYIGHFCPFDGIFEKGASENVYLTSRYRRASKCALMIATRKSHSRDFW